ncbi:MAG: GNAT family N-acetyltransferase [Oscillospiraceae bacterium]|nr:GNAT family N-acetyltransferase [Oscillospiraceae bacterium]
MEYVVEKEISQDSINQIVAIAEDYTKDFFTENYPEDMRIDMKFQRAVILKNNSRIVSCIVFTCLDGSPHITLMATKRDYNNKGYGKLLMQYFVEYVSELGFNSIELYTFSPETRPIYTATIKFYQSVGFEVQREHKDLWGIGTTTLKMRKNW